MALASDESAEETMRMTPGEFFPAVTSWLTAGIFLLTYAGLAVGRVPGLRMDRAGIAFVGAAAMLASGVLSLAEATSPAAIDYETIVLLLGMMVVVGALRLSGLFDLLTGWALGRIRQPRQLLLAIILLAGLLSAFLVNDIVCLALTPLVLRVAKRLEFSPLPQLVGLATAANIGSVGTIAGNPQNMIIGVQSQLSYLRFAAHLLPLALLGLGLDFLVVAWVYRRLLLPRVPGAGIGAAVDGTGVLGTPADGGDGGSRSTAPAPQNSDGERWVTGPAAVGSTDGTAARQALRLCRSGLRRKSIAVAVAASTAGSAAREARRLRRLAGLRRKSVIVAAVTVVLFLCGLPMAVVAAAAAAVILMGRLAPERIYRQIDWSLLLLFAALFIVVHGFQVHVLGGLGAASWQRLGGQPLVLLSVATAALSNLVSNVPAVLLLAPLARAAPVALREGAWLALAMASTFAGNLTILGSVANLIVVEGARREGVRISFWEYFRCGVPVTGLTLGLGIGWVLLVRW